MLVPRHGPIILTCLKHRVETMLVNNKDHNPNVFGQRAVD